MRPRRMGLALLAASVPLAGCGGGSSATPSGGGSTRVISTVRGAARAEIPATYTIEGLGRDASSGRYVLRLTTTMVITLDSIGRREAALTTIAARHHGTLDGWEAAPTP